MEINDTEKTMLLVKNLEFEEAVSHLIHSRMFEILGYLSIIKDYKDILPDGEQLCFNRVEELSKNLLNEIHLVIDHYKNNNKKVVGVK
jgi:hypothetical protein